MIFKGTRIKEKDGLAKLVANVNLDENTKKSLREKTDYHFENDANDIPLYSYPAIFGNGKKDRKKCVQYKRRIFLHTSEGKVSGIMPWKDSLHIRIKGYKKFVNDFYEILKNKF